MEKKYFGRDAYFKDVIEKNKAVDVIIKGDNPPINKPSFSSVDGDNVVAPDNTNENENKETE
jgi:hypothetical protein